MFLLLYKLDFLFETVIESVSQLIKCLYMPLGLIRNNDVLYYDAQTIRMCVGTQCEGGSD